MTLVLLVAGALVLLLLSQLLQAGLLWLSAKVARIPEASYRRCVLAALVLSLVGTLFTLVSLALAGQAPAAALVLELLGIGVLFVLLMALLRATVAKTFVAGLLMTIGQLGLSIALIFGLKNYVVETFVIPTGAMANTLLGYHKEHTCPHCGAPVTVNASSEAQPFSSQPPMRVTHGTCPNCRQTVDFDKSPVAVPLRGGDRILCTKFGLADYQRYQVVVFRFPVEPLVNGLPMNYVKRLIGLPGETIAIRQGQLYVSQAARSVPTPEHFWAEARHSSYDWPEDEEAARLFRAGQFEILRKPLSLLLEQSHLVYDSQFVPVDAASRLPCWDAQAGWKTEPSPGGFTLPAPNPTVAWLRYRHRPGGVVQPQLITDFSDYNSGEASGRGNGTHWVGDLLLEAEIQINQADPQGELRLELSKGANRFQARFNLDTGDCTLLRLADGQEAVLPLDALQQDGPPATRSTAVRGQGSYRIRFADVDERLTLWVGDELPFGAGVAYAAAQQAGPTAHDLEPASLGVRGAAVQVAQIRLSRDTYYTGDAGRGSDEMYLTGDALSEPARWEKGDFRSPTPLLMYVHPGHYLCLGDNSSASADSRSWGLVPKNLMVGPVALIYWPPARSRWLR